MQRKTVPNLQQGSPQTPHVAWEFEEEWDKGRWSTVCKSIRAQVTVHSKTERKHHMACMFAVVVYSGESEGYKRIVEEKFACNAVVSGEELLLEEVRAALTLRAYVGYKMCRITITVQGEGEDL